MSGPYRHLTRLLLAAGCVGTLGAVAFVSINVTGDAEPCWVETRLAKTLLDGKLRAHRATKPALSFSEEDLQKATDIYEQQCGLCHGVRRGKEAPFAKSFSPRPPQRSPSALLPS